MALTSVQNIMILFTEIFFYLETKCYISYAVSGLFLILAFILILMKLVKISKSLICIMEIFTELSESDIKSVRKYSKQTLLTFEHLSHRYENLK